MTRDAPLLVARDPELADLAQRLREAGERSSGQVLVTGPVGVGRTALVTRLAATHPGVTLRGRGAPWESSKPYAVLAQLLGRDVEPADPFEAAELLVRELAAREQIARDEGSDGGPGLVLVDDAEWSDPASLEALSSTVEHHRDRRFLVLLVTAVGQAAPATTLLLDKVSDRVVVRPLDARGVRELAASRGVLLRPSLADRLCRHTGGMPRHVVALLDELPPDTWSGFDPELPAPAGVRATVVERLAAIPDAARALVEAVSVLGSEGSLVEAAALAELADPLVALDESERAGLVRITERRGATRLEPGSPMTAAAVLDGLGPLRRAELHRRAAEVIDDPARRLGHLVAAAPLPDSSLADELDDLAAERAAAGAWGAAADLLASASRLTSDVHVRDNRLTRAVDALIGAGDTLAAVALVPEVESLRETPLRNAVLGYLAIVRGRPAEAETRLRRAWDLVNVEREPEVAAMICQRWVLHSLSRCRGADLVTWADRAVGLVPAASPAAVEAVAIRGLGVAGTGRPREAVAEYTRLTDAVGHGAQAQRVALGKGWSHLVLDEVDEAHAALESALPTDILGGSTRISLWAHAWLARAQFVRGDWHDALRTAQDGLDLAERSGMKLVVPLLSWTRVQVLALRGEWDSAGEALRAGDAGPRDYEIMRVPACLARAQYAEAQADYAAVARALEVLRQPWAGAGIDEPGAWPWQDVYANALVVLGRYDDADSFLRPHERLADERGHRAARARLGYARGRLHGVRGDLDGARACFESSLELLEDLPLRYDRARVNFAFGQTLRRAGKRREADVVITAARELYLALGASTYVSRCDRELKAGGVHVARVDRRFDELTPQEQAVSELVAGGMTNREVAAELYLSMKTVQYHLTRIYAKLGIRSRSELAALSRPTSGAEQS